MVCIFMGEDGLGILFVGMCLWQVRQNPSCELELGPRPVFYCALLWNLEALRGLALSKGDPVIHA